MKNVKIGKIGQLLVSKFSQIHVWDEDLDYWLDELTKGQIMLVVGEKYSGTSVRLDLNSDLYRKVLTPNKKVGWVHLDNCVLLTKNI